jgi:hypothetical protein
VSQDVSGPAWLRSAFAVTSMDAAAFQTVYMSGTQAEADIVIGLLRSAGLHPLDLLTTPHVGFAGAEVGYRDVIQILIRETHEAEPIVPAKPGKPPH